MKPSDRRRLLKIKLKALAQEARLIRSEETKIKYMGPNWRPENEPMREAMYHHRVGPVRNESRHTLLAYSFIRGRKYRQIEQFAREAPDTKHIYEMVRRYGDGTASLQSIKDWVLEGAYRTRADSQSETAAAFNP